MNAYDSRSNSVTAGGITIPLDMADPKQGGLLIAALAHDRALDELKRRAELMERIAKRLQEPRDEDGAVLTSAIAAAAEVEAAQAKVSVAGDILAALVRGFSK